MTREAFSEAARQKSFREADEAIRRASKKAISGQKKAAAKGPKMFSRAPRKPRKTSAAKLWSGAKKSPSSLLKVNKGGLAGVCYALRKGRLLDTDMMGCTTSEFLAQFALDQARAPRVKNLFIHKSISFHNSLEVSDEVAREHVKRYLKHAGFEGCQYMVVVHEDSDNFHCHVIVSRVTPSGGTVDMGHNYYKWRAALRKAERESGLPEFVLSEAVAEGQSDHMVNTMRRSEREQSLKNWVRKDSVIAARNSSRSLPEFQIELKKRGLEMELSKRADGTTTGLMIRSVGSDRFLSASSIDRSVTLPKLQAHWNRMATPVKPGLPVRPAHAPGQRPLPVPVQQPHTPRQRGG